MIKLVTNFSMVVIIVVLFLAIKMRKKDKK